MPTARPDTATIASGADLWAGRDAHVVVSFGTNAVWTWFNDPRAVYLNGATYWMGVDSAGTTKIHRRDHATAAVTSFTLGPVGHDKDDHNNGSILVLPDGRLVAFWAIHYDTVVRYRVSTNPYSIAAFGAENQIAVGQTPVTYTKPFRLSDAPGKQWVFYRRGPTDNSVLSFRAADDFGATTPTLDAEQTVATTTGKTPYVIMYPDGVNRVDVLCTGSHPVQDFSVAYHFYGQLDGSGNLLWYRSDGTQITASTPWTYATECTRISALTERQWIWDIKRTADGVVHVIWVRLMNGVGTDHRYMYAKCVGGVWQASVEIAAAGGYLYAGERYYSGGAVFDSQDVTTIYASVQVDGVFQMQRYTTSDGGASWTLQTTYTSGGTFNNPNRARPYSPRDHNGDVPVLWWEGDYTTYLDFNTVTHGLVRQ